jgi:hypothetical protein
VLLTSLHADAKSTGGRDKGDDGFNVSAEADDSKKKPLKVCIYKHPQLTIHPH